MNNNGFNNQSLNGMEYFPPEDIAGNKTMCVLAYIPFLFLFPMLTCKNSRFVRFHCNQGIVLTIFTIVFTILLFILGFVTGFLGAFMSASVEALFMCLYTLLYLGLVIGYYIYFILGVYNAVKGRAKKLPLIGGIKILKW
ncbi:MAG: hypothetical protein U0M12_09660 [Acutalibacteraceae bacterium]|nr:hypothetical protein [Acutalibacteraceae bacterium]